MCVLVAGGGHSWLSRGHVQMRRVILIRPCVCFGSMVILIQYLFGCGCVDDVYQSVGVSGQVECSLQ